MGTLLVLLALVAPGPPDDAGERARGILAAGGYQTELPRARVAPVTPRDEDRGGSPRDGGASVLLWLLLGGGLVLLLVVLRSRLAARGDVQLTQPDAAPDEPAAIRDPGPVPADELARAGRFAEAAHVLLLETLATLARRTRTPWSVAETVREFAGRLGLPGRAGAALRALLVTVERALYRGDPIDESTWLALREHARTSLRERAP